MVKNPAANTGDAREAGSIPGWERSPREGNGNPLQYSCLENPTDREPWWATVQGVGTSDTAEHITQSYLDMECMWTSEKLNVYLNLEITGCIFFCSFFIYLVVFVFYCLFNRHPRSVGFL